MFIAALFTIARTRKQPRCPSADEWIRKLWYIYTMEYYSAIKKNTFESVLMRWMKLEPLIQSEGEGNGTPSYTEWGRRQWHSIPVLLPGKSHGLRSLVGYSPWGLRVRHDWATSLSLFNFMHWRRKWQPTPVFLPGESQGWGNLVGCHLWGRTESDTEAT